MEKKPLRLPQLPKFHIQLPRTFREFEKAMAIVLGADGVLFLLYLLFAALGVGWLKTTLAILAILISILSLGILFLKQEIRRPRSRWLLAGFCAVMLCLVFSMLFRYPRPAPKAANPDASATAPVQDSQNSDLNSNDAAG